MIIFRDFFLRWIWVLQITLLRYNFGKFVIEVAEKAVLMYFTKL